MMGSQKCCGFFARYIIFKNPFSRLKGVHTNCILSLQGMQVVVLALIRSIPPIASVAMFGLFEFIVFAIIGVQLFSGRLGACNQVVSTWS